MYLPKMIVIVHSHYLGARPEFDQKEQMAIYNLTPLNNLLRNQSMFQQYSPSMMFPHYPPATSILHPSNLHLSCYRVQSCAGNQHVFFKLKLRNLPFSELNSGQILELQRASRI
jgi:hypothetical protein